MKTRLIRRWEIAGLTFEVRFKLVNGRDEYCVRVKQHGHQDAWLENHTNTTDTWETESGAHYHMLMFLEEYVK